MRPDATYQNMYENHFRIVEARDHEKVQIVCTKAIHGPTSSSSSRMAQPTTPSNVLACAPPPFKLIKDLLFSPALILRS